MICPAKTDTYSAGDTSDSARCSASTCPTTTTLSRLKKAPQALGALHSKIFSSRDIPEQLKGNV
jgi:hypothetical protein